MLSKILHDRGNHTAHEPDEKSSSDHDDGMQSSLLWLVSPLSGPALLARFWTNQSTENREAAEKENYRCEGQKQSIDDDKGNTQLYHQDHDYDGNQPNTSNGDVSHPDTCWAVEAQVENGVNKS